MKRTAVRTQLGKSQVPAELVAAPTRFHAYHAVEFENSAAAASCCLVYSTSVLPGAAFTLNSFLSARRRSPPRGAALGRCCERQTRGAQSVPVSGPVLGR